MCGGSSNDGPGSTSGKSEGGYGGLGMGNPGSYGGKNDPGRTSEGGYGKSGFGGSNRGDTGAPAGLRSIEDMHKGLAMAGPQLSRAKDNAFATGLSYGLQALGMMGTPFGGAIAMGVRAARDYGRGYAERTSMEKAAAANGMGATATGDSSGIQQPRSSGLSGIAKPVAQAPARAAASGNVGSGQAGATVIMGADKTRTGAGAGSRAKSSSAVRGLGSGGLKL